MSIKQHIPNGITLLNLLCGCIAVIFAVYGHLVVATGFVFLGIIFDFLDGFVARKLKVQSALGIQLDSLADLVTSGVVPGIVMFKLLALTIHSSELNSNDWNTSIDWQSLKVLLLPSVGLLIALASAYRLAKFNIDEDQQTYFKGLPVPANTILILSLPLIIEFQNSDAMNAIIINKWFLIGLTLLSCYLLNSNIKLFSLKFKDWSFKANTVRYIYLILIVIALVIFQFAAFPLLIILYIILSLLDRKNIT